MKRLRSREIASIWAISSAAQPSYPRFERLVRAFDDWLVDRNAHTLVLGEVERLKGLQHAVFIDRFNNTGHHVTLLSCIDPMMSSSGYLLFKPIIMMQPTQNRTHHHMVRFRPSVPVCL